MSDSRMSFAEPFKTNHSLRPATEVAKEFGFATDYITRLARSGELRGEKVGKKWCIDVDSLSEYIRKQEEKKSQLRKQLVQKRRVEYQVQSPSKIAPTASRAPLNNETASHQGSNHVDESEALAPVTRALRKAAFSRKTEAALVHSAFPVYTIHPALEFVHKVTALFGAVVLVFGAYGLADMHFRTFAMQTIVHDAGRVVALSIESARAVGGVMSQLDEAIASGDVTDTAAAAIASFLDN